LFFDWLFGNNCQRGHKIHSAIVNSGKRAIVWQAKLQYAYILNKTNQSLWLWQVNLKTEKQQTGAYTPQSHFPRVTRLPDKPLSFSDDLASA
jgi:hypothetical protein